MLAHFHVKLDPTLTKDVKMVQVQFRLSQTKDFKFIVVASLFDPTDKCSLIQNNECKSPLQ